MSAGSRSGVNWTRRNSPENAARERLGQRRLARRRARPPAAGGGRRRARPARDRSPRACRGSRGRARRAAAGASAGPGRSSAGHLEAQVDDRESAGRALQSAGASTPRSRSAGTTTRRSRCVSFSVRCFERYRADGRTARVRLRDERGGLAEARPGLRSRAARWLLNHDTRAGARRLMRRCRGAPGANTASGRSAISIPAGTACRSGSVRIHARCCGASGAPTKRRAGVRLPGRGAIDEERVPARAATTSAVTAPRSRSVAGPRTTRDALPGGRLLDHGQELLPAAGSWRSSRRPSSSTRASKRAWSSSAARRARPARPRPANPWRSRGRDAAARASSRLLARTTNPQRSPSSRFSRS